MRFILLLLLFSLPAVADINLETHEFVFEYGLAYHTVKGEQKDNKTEGKIVTNQMPYYGGSYTIRLGQRFALKAFGKMQFVKFEEPDFGSLKNEDQVLNQFGLEFITKTGAFSKLGFFVSQEDHPLYFAKTPTDFEILKKTFVESGLHYSLSQRRRIGLIWALGAKGFFIFPTDGGNVTTEAGFGTEGYARLGWIGPFGTVIQIKGFYQYTAAPNSDINFSHESLGYAGMLIYTF